MFTYDLISAIDGSHLGQVEATAPDWAGLRFLKTIGWNGLTGDVVILLNRRVVAIISDRGNHRPDIMVIEVMREQIMARGKRTA